MRYEYHDKKQGAILGLSEDIKRDISEFSITNSTIKLLWNQNSSALRLKVDEVELELGPDQLMTTTYLQHLSFQDTALPLTAFTFNREFYCISDHDQEVSCNGILFFGAQDIPVVTIPESQLKKFYTLYEVFQEEFSEPDTIQGDMLQMLLKRLIIITTRLAKEQLVVKQLNNDQVETIRKFNYLVDMHYRKKRKVSDYAELLFKSPKTLSNLFAIYNQKSPQQVIQERLALEAKRMLHYTDKQSQEIAFDLGFNDAAHFSKFFKKMTGTTPTDFKQIPQTAT